MKDKITVLKKTARTAGLLYLLFALTAIYGFMYVSPKISLSGGPVATANNVLNHEFLFRTSIASDLITNVLFVIVVLILYRLFRQVNEFLAKLMVGLVMVAIPVVLLGGGLKVIALSIFNGDMLNSFSAQQKFELATTFIRLANYSSRIITIFWGLWLVPLGLLVFRSVFIPRVLGLLLIVNGLGYIIKSLTFILMPQYQATVSRFTFPTYFIGEIPFILWLLIVGVRDHLSIIVVGETNSELKAKKVKEYSQ
ncbi:MAG TPA: DUF4386 domain-containing protein [Chitinophagaceae bacterium]|nr:DUF4386 domain-containing protein [Chitinophagaceae bacterium]